jgi:hypothetical protein
MILNALSLASSATYWYLDTYNKHDNIKLLFKFLSIILLTNWNYLLYSSILTSYALGDIIIYYNQKHSLIFFGLGHIIFMINFIKEYLFLTTLMTPVILSSATFIYILLEYESKIYYLYILILHYLFITTILHDYYGKILFIISDISISANLIDCIEWPLYYFSILYLQYWFNDSNLYI